MSFYVKNENQNKHNGALYGNQSTFLRDILTQNTSECRSKLDDNEEYVVHDETNTCNHGFNAVKRSERSPKRLQQNDRKNIDRRSRNNIYLQQMPRISKCNVQLSFEGVYDNEASSDSILPTTGSTNNDFQNRIKVNKNSSNACFEFPLACKLILGFIGLVLISGAIASWSTVLVKQDSSKGSFF